MDIIDLFMHTGQINQKQGEINNTPDIPQPEPEPEPEPQPPIPDLGTDYFEFTIKGNNFSIPLSGVNGSGVTYQSYDWIIDWGDDVIEEKSGMGSANNVDVIHNYSGAETDTHTIKIYPNGDTVDGWFNAFGGGGYNETNMRKIISINSQIKTGWRNMNSYGYARMFIYTSITSIPANLLPATTLALQCYQQMFDNCTSLTSIPANLLPATTLTDACYSTMFRNCTSLTSIPANLLPATTLVYQCYQQMFRNCTNLTNIGNMNAAWFSAKSANKQPNMFTDCPNITTPITYANIPTGWK
jgi:hypothetical protein